MPGGAAGFRESGVVDRLTKSTQNEIINMTTIFLGTSVGLTMGAENFLQPKTLMIIVMGVVAFGFSTVGGVLLAKLMNKLSPGNPINPLIGSAGVSAVPMAARVSQVVGAQYDKQNFLLMHAMGPNVAGVIGTAVCAGYFAAPALGLGPRLSHVYLPTNRAFWLNAALSEHWIYLG